MKKKNENYLLLGLGALLVSVLLFGKKEEKVVEETKTTSDLGNDKNDKVDVAEEVIETSTTTASPTVETNKPVFEQTTVPQDLEINL